MKINQIWNLIENDNSFSAGLLRRRYSSAVIPNIYVAIHFPEKLFCLYISINESVEVNISSFSNLQEIQVDFFKTPDEKGTNSLVFKLLNNQHKDIFALLCEDLINTVANENNDKKLVKEIINRFEKWKSLFNKISQQGLSPEEQRGLFGELCFLKTFLEQEPNFSNIIASWVGPEKETKDFQYSSWACEIKTTHGNNHQKVNISNERQLDSSNLEYLFLNHLSLEVSHSSGETLNDIVDSINDKLQIDQIASNQFKLKLMTVGYLDSQRKLYENIGYFIRNDNVYLITEGFPRIEEKDVKPGVGDVKYSIILSQCSSYLVNSTFLFDILKFEDKKIGKDRT